MINGAVAVHLDHCGWEVKDARCQHKQPQRVIVGLTDGKGGDRKEEPVGVENNHTVDGNRGNADDKDVQECELFRKDGSRKIKIDLCGVTLQGNHDQRERRVLSQDTSHYCLNLAGELTKGPAFSETWIDSPQIDEHVCEYQTQGEGGY